MTLQHLLVEFKPDGIQVRTLYRQKDGPNPDTKARAREVTTLARTGLTQALEALEGRVDVIGTSGYEVREDTISTTSEGGPHAPA